ncbi:hypothetical protein TRVL_08483 [Trypanosoma vivax]|nr:hypothetical protein TRVL_08483 [Trypanosoma vivax]
MGRDFRFPAAVVKGEGKLAPLVGDFLCVTAKGWCAPFLKSGSILRLSPNCQGHFYSQEKLLGLNYLEETLTPHAEDTEGAYLTYFFPLFLDCCICYAQKKALPTDKKNAKLMKKTQPPYKHENLDVLLFPLRRLFKYWDNHTFKGCKTKMLTPSNGKFAGDNAILDQMLLASLY